MDAESGKHRGERAEQGGGGRSDDSANFDLTLPEAEFHDSVDGGGQPDAGGATPPGKRMPKLEPATEAPEIADVTITEQLGRGGQGVVFRGFQEFLQRDVAVKVLHRSVDRDLARFQKEATLLASLQHPNIVACYQAGVGTDGECYMVLEFVNGPDLFQYVKSNGPLDEDTSLGLAADVAQGLKHGYEQNSRMIHRDVKPQNILIQTPGSGSGPALRAKVVDLGLARCLEESMELTRPGAVMGTPVSMAPEQFDCPGEADHRTDIYGLGCVIFYTLTGDPAFKGATLTAIYRQKTAQKSAKPHKDLELHPGTRSLLDRMLAPEQDKRHVDYDALLAEIAEVRRLLNEERARGSKKNGGKPWILPVAGMAALAFGAGGYFVMTADKTEIPSEPEPPESDPDDEEEPPIGPDPENGGSEPENPIVTKGIKLPALLPALSKGVTRRLLGTDGRSDDWARLEGNPTGDGPGVPLTSLQGQADQSWIEVDQPAQFKDPRRDGLTALEFVNSLNAYPKDGVPIPFYVPAASAVIHPVPDGPWKLEGDFALCKRGPGAYLLGGLVFHREDGSYLEVVVGDINPQEAPASQRAAKGLPKKPRGMVRALWFNAEDVPLIADSVGRCVTPGETPAERSSTLLGSRGGELQPEREFVALTFRLVVTAEGEAKLILGDDRDLYVEAPPDLASNPIRRVAVFARDGDVSLRRWAFSDAR